MKYANLAKQAAEMTVTDDPAQLFWEAYSVLVVARHPVDRARLMRLLAEQAHLQAASFIQQRAFPHLGFTVNSISGDSRACLIRGRDFQILWGPKGGAYDGLALLHATLSYAHAIAGDVRASA